MNRNKLLLAVVLVSSAAIATWYAGLAERPTPSARSMQDQARDWAAASTLPVPQKVEPAERGLAGSHVYSEEDQQLITELRGRFAERLQVKHAQIKLIEQLLSYLKEKYPGNWKELAAQFLQDLFPELAEALIAKFEGLMAYSDWLIVHRDELRVMSASERRAALWAARYATFGEDANEIWAIDLKNQQIREALLSLDRLDGLDVDAQLDTYLSAIHAAYGDQADDFMGSRQAELTGQFLAVEAVQAQLHGLSNSERAAALTDIRRAMGMPPEALQRWSSLDAQRDAQWARGQSYMQQHSQIRQTYSGEEEERELARLRRESFGDEQAKTIEAEEQAGFYRYANRRRIGRE